MASKEIEKKNEIASKEIEKKNDMIGLKVINFTTDKSMVFDLDRNMDFVTGVYIVLSIFEEQFEFTFTPSQKFDNDLLLKNNVVADNGLQMKKESHFTEIEKLSKEEPNIHFIKVIYDSDTNIIRTDNKNVRDGVVWICRALGIAYISM